MVFYGRVRFRSSLGSVAGTEAPGEAEIQRLNPGRGSSIRKATGWNSLAQGSLNLAVDHQIVEALAAFEPTLEEPAEGIAYPPPHEVIPSIRRGYWYYLGVARKNGAEEEVLVRRAIVPLQGVVELFSRVSLTNKFNLVTDDLLTVEVRAPVKVQTGSRGQMDGIGEGK